MPGTGVSKLAEQLAIHQSTCSQLVEKLVARGLIIKERSKEDQRRVGLRLSDEATILVSRAPGPSEGILPEALKALPHDALLQLETSLEKVIEQLQIKDAKLANRPLSDM